MTSADSNTPAGKTSPHRTAATANNGTTHGGARPNAGRKPTGRVRLVVHLKPATRSAIRKAARAANKTTGEFLEVRFPGKPV